MRYKKKTTKEIQTNPIFVSNRNNPITEGWIRTIFRSLAKKSRFVKINEKTKNPESNPNSLRVLLKSTLMACDTDMGIADEAIGHKTPEKFGKYSKQDMKNMQNEYAKASGTINVFSRLGNIINNIDYDTQNRSNV